MTAKFVFVGTWSGKLMVYDVAREFKLLNYLKCKQSVRSICQLSDNILIVGQNEGYIELVALSKLNQIEIISSKRFDRLGHIF